MAADAALLRAYEDATPIKDVDGGPEPLDLGELDAVLARARTVLEPGDV